MEVICHPRWFSCFVSSELVCSICNILILRGSSVLTARHLMNLLAVKSQEDQKPFPRVSTRRGGRRQVCGTYCSALLPSLLLNGRGLLGSHRNTTAVPWPQLPLKFGKRWVAAPQDLCPIKHGFWGTDFRGRGMILHPWHWRGSPGCSVGLQQGRVSPWLLWFLARVGGTISPHTHTHSDAMLQVILRRNNTRSCSNMILKCLYIKKYIFYWGLLRISVIEDLDFNITIWKCTCNFSSDHINAKPLYMVVMLN